jgi:hypothetical protein
VLSTGAQWAAGARPLTTIDHWPNVENLQTQLGGVAVPWQFPLWMQYFYPGNCHNFMHETSRHWWIADNEEWRRALYPLWMFISASLGSRLCGLDILDEQAELASSAQQGQAALDLAQSAALTSMVALNGRSTYRLHDDVCCTYWDIDSLQTRLVGLMFCLYTGSESVRAIHVVDFTVIILGSSHVDFSSLNSNISHICF